MENQLVKEYRYKRPFDIALASFGLVFFFPLFILFSFLIWYEDRGRVFYKQKKIGRDKKELYILKLRSMSMDSEEIPANSIKNGYSRIKITKIGKFLRATAMDELPQLISILKGDMSFVGPRPLMPSETNILMPDVVSMRTSVRPGLTGLAQIWTDKYMPISIKSKYDLIYINTQSLWLDIKIIFYSILITIKRKWESKVKKIALLLL